METQKGASILTHKDQSQSLRMFYTKNFYNNPT